MNMFLQLYGKKNVVFQLHSEAQNKNTKIFVKKPKWNLGNIRVFLLFVEGYLLFRNNGGTKQL